MSTLLHVKLDWRRIHRWLVFVLVLSIPFNRHHIFFSYSPKLDGNYNDFLAVSLYLADILLMAVFALDIALYGLKTSIKWPILAFFAYILLRSVFPHETNYYYLIKWLELAIILTIFARVTTRGGFTRNIYQLIVLSGIFQSLIGFWQFIKQGSIGLGILGEQILGPALPGIAKIDLGIDKYIRAYGTFSHPNPLSAFLVVACVTAAYLLITEKANKYRGFWILGLGINVIGVLITFSRAAYITLPIALAFMFIIWLFHVKHEKPETKIILKTIAVVVVSFVIGIGALYPYLKTRATISDQATEQRIEYNEIGAQIFKEHPYIGVGQSDMLYTIAEKMGKYDYIWQVQPPHNYFILIASATGSIGLVLFVIMFADLFTRLWIKIKESREAILLCSLLLGTFILMQFDHYFFTTEQTMLLFWMIMGIGYGMIKKTA